VRISTTPLDNCPARIGPSGLSGSMPLTLSKIHPYKRSVQKSFILNNLYYYINILIKLPRFDSALIGASVEI